MAHQFDHEKLDVYRLSIEFVGWVIRLVADMDGFARQARDQLLRSSQSIPLNIAEGNGKRAGKDRCRSFEIARGSAMESAATLDVIAAIGAASSESIEQGKAMQLRIVSMLTKLAPPKD
ncbi:MAG: four helix bundle protein [Planctomycetes bacterium]|nr:four helix bundle protein [Planctomycetota bacterium]